MRGYIKVDRGILTHPALAKRDQSLCERGAFLWLLLEASFANRKYRIQNQEIELKRGQLCCSINYMAKAFNWDRSKVQRFLNKLKLFNTITTNTPTNTSADIPNIITISNYDDYQDTPSDTPTNTKHNKLINNDNKYIGEFDELWSKLRAKKGSKKKARDKYLKIRSKVKASTLIEKYNKLCDETKDFTYIPHFITWLNGERYLDEDKQETIKKISIDQHFRETHRWVVPKGFCFVGNSWNEVEYTNGKEKLTFNIRTGEKI
tara:strand:- start:74 stop:859 length:786 start_codon:yes stop_codon:yes gene_type:complete